MGNISAQFSSVTVIFLTGIAWGVYFDFYRAWVGRRFQKISLTSGLWDLFFWCGSTLLLGTGLVAANWLELRFYVFVGLLLGYTFYAVLGRPLMFPVYRGVLNCFAVIGYPWRRIKEQWVWRWWVWLRKVEPRLWGLTKREEKQDNPS